MSKNTVAFFKAKCEKTGKTFYVRFDLAADDKWCQSYGLKDLPTEGIESSAKTEDIKIDTSNFRVGPQYKCPHCGNTGIVSCGNCHCCHDGSNMWHCPKTDERGYLKEGEYTKSYFGAGGNGQ